MTDRTSAQFFELVRSGLWGVKASADLFAGGADWDSLCRAAARQSLTGIFSDGINTLPQQMMPPADTARKLFVSVESIRRANMKLESVLAELVTLLRDNGIEGILLKGQGLARNYPVPNHRMCGDIDMYTGKDYERSCSLVRTFGESEGHEDECEKHFHFERRGCTIEIHKYVNVDPNPFSDRKLQAWSDALLGNPSDLRQTVICGTEVNLPPVQFDALFILLHIADHLIRGGIGLRQLCDWCRFMAVHHDEIDIRALEKDVRRLKLMNIWRIMGWIAVNRLGLPEEMMPFYSDNAERKALICLDTIMRQGNFGQYGAVQRPGRETAFLRRKLLNSLVVIRQQSELLRMIPCEVLRFLPWYILDGLRRMLSGK